MPAAAQRLTVTTEQTIEAAERAPLLRFQFDADSEDAEARRGRRGKPRSIKEALIRWLDEQL